MGNPLYNSMQNHQNGSMFGNLSAFFKNLQQLKQSGIDPNQKIQELLNSGQVTQEQYNAAAEQAKQIQAMLGRR